MTLIDEFTRECLAIRVARRINSLGVLETMADAMLVRGLPEHIRSDNGPEMTAKIVRSGWRILEPRRSTSNRAAPGKTAIAKASTASCGTSCSMAKSSAASRKLRSSSSNGVTTTTPSDPTHRWDIGHLLHRLLCPRHPIWMERQPCSSLTHAGTKYPAGQLFSTGRMPTA